MYKIGKVSKQERFIRIINTLTNQKHTLKICEEDTINDIIKKYYRYNAHTGSYSWRKYARGVIKFSYIFELFEFFISFKFSPK